MKQLTSAEEQAMRYLWKLKKAFVKEIIAEYPDPKPAYNTVSTFMRILEKKGFVNHEAFGKSHRYFPSVSETDYKKQTTGKVLRDYFHGSIGNMLSFFDSEIGLSKDELNQLETFIKQKKNDKSGNK